ncbi:hypothetical protein HKD37_12G034106 [Glycine soja]
MFFVSQRRSKNTLKLRFDEYGCIFFVALTLMRFVSPPRLLQKVEEHTKVTIFMTTVVVHLRATVDASILKQSKFESHQRCFYPEAIQIQGIPFRPSFLMVVVHLRAIGDAPILKQCKLKNVIEVPLSYHRQWSPNYPTYVLFNYKGNKHFIKLHKYADRFFFGDGLKELRRTHGIYESVIMRFVAWDKNITFNVDVVGPLHRQTHQRSAATTKRHVFTIDVSEDMIQHNYQLVLPPEASNYLSGSKKYMIVDHGRDRLYEWMITMNNGLSYIAESWIQYLTNNHLKAGDEVVFYYNFDQHL